MEGVSFRQKEQLRLRSKEGGSWGVDTCHGLLALLIRQGPGGGWKGQGQGATWSCRPTLQGSSLAAA